MEQAVIHDALKSALEKWGNRNFIYSATKDAFAPKPFKSTVCDAWALAESLLALGLYGKHILIYGENSYEWAVSDFAVTGYVGVAVAANKEWKQHDLENAINIADVSCVIYSNTKKDVIESVKSKFDIKYISIQDDFPFLLKSGHGLLDRKKKQDDFKLKSAGEMCRIYFTSGTTSVPKAVMLSDKNLFSGFKSLYKRAAIGTADRAYLILPLSHTYGGIYNLLACLCFGTELYLCSDADKMLEEMRMCSPTVFCGVPLIYERIYAMLGDDAVKDAQTNRNEAVIQKIKFMLGGNIKYLFCGGAKLNNNIKKFFRDIGFCILEAYALTETASSLSIEYPGGTSLASVGTVFEDIEVKFINIDENGRGEILVKGDNVALGYYNNAKETGRVFDRDGYFHTGDIGYKDENGRLFLAGRKKRAIVFSNGEKIYPDEIEGLLVKNECVAVARVFEKNNKLAAVLYLRGDVDAAQLIKKTNELLPTYKQIKTFEISYL